MDTPDEIATEKQARSLARRFDRIKYHGLLLRLLRAGWLPKEIWFEYFPSETCRTVTSYIHHTPELSEAYFEARCKLIAQDYLPIAEKRKMRGHSRTVSLEEGGSPTVSRPRLVASIHRKG